MSVSNAPSVALAAPPGTPAPRSHRTPVEVASRWGVGAILVAISGWLIIVQEQFRMAEAFVMTVLLKPFLGEAVFAFRDQFVIKQDATHYLGLQITIECTTLVLLVPMLVFLAALLIFPRNTRWSRWIIGGLAGAAMISIINLMRIGMIAASTLFWDRAGYEWSHIVVGSVFSLIGMVATLIVTLRIITGRRTRRRL